MPNYSALGYYNMCYVILSILVRFPDTQVSWEPDDLLKKTRNCRIFPKSKKFILMPNDSHPI